MVYGEKLHENFFKIIAYMLKNGDGFGAKSWFIRCLETENGLSRQVKVYQLIATVSVS